MGRYYTWGRCLDCEREVGDAAVCPHCGLSQDNEEAARIRWHLYQADVALETSRHPVSAPQPVAAVPTVQPLPQVPGMTPFPQVPGIPPASRRDRGSVWPAFSTSTILLGLGALCVLVAAVVFVSVSWSDLSLAAKAAILLTVTAAIGALAAWMLRLGLRGSAESLSALFTLFVVIDFSAAVNGGLFGLGSLPSLAASWISAALLTVVGLAWAVAARPTRVRQLSVVQLLAAAGVGWLVVLAFDGEWARPEFVAFGLVVALVAVAAVGARPSTWTFAVWVCVVAVGVLLSAYVVSLGRVLRHDSLHSLWLHGRSVGWVCCLVIAAGLASVPLLRLVVRRLAATVAVVGLALLLLRPLTDEPYNDLLAGLIAASVVAVGLSLLVGTPWRFGLAVGGAATSIGLAAVLSPSALNALVVASQPAGNPWSQLPSAHPADPDNSWLTGIGSPWVIGLGTAVMLLCWQVLITRRVPRPEVVAAVGLVGVGVGGLQYDMSLWGVVAVCGGVAIAAGLVGALSRSGWPLAVSLWFTVLALTAALGSDQTTLVVAAVLGLVLGGLSLRLPSMEVASAAASGAALFVGLAVAALAHWAGWPQGATPYALVGLAAVCFVGAQGRPAGGAFVRQRLGLEGGAAVLAAVAIGVAANQDLDVQTPVCLTVAGTVLVAVSLLRPDRRLLSVVGGLLLASASWVRLAAEDVEVVEAYTLPSALVLVGLGAVRMRRTPGASSVTSMTPGLSLALMPSLAVALGDPTSLRALLLVIAGAAVLVAGAYLRWVAPLLIGGVVVLVLAIVNVAPYAAALPRWVLFAAVGAALLFLGVTWERRLREARSLLAAVERLA